MRGYVTIGAIDPEASVKFYDAVLGATGMRRSFFEGGWAGYAHPGSDDSVFVCLPFDGKPARGGNGIMIAFEAATRDEVKAAHAAGLTGGGTDEGAPGPRPPESDTFFGAYLRDPAGNKVALYTRAKR